jgi:hypothetical protein
MRPIPHDDHLPAPEPPENGLAFLEQMECEDGASAEAIQHSSDINTSQRRELQNQNDLISQNLMISFETFLCQKTKQNCLLLQ